MVFQAACVARKSVAFLPQVQIVQSDQSQPPLAVKSVSTVQTVLTTVSALTLRGRRAPRQKQMSKNKRGALPPAAA